MCIKLMFVCLLVAALPTSSPTAVVSPQPQSVSPGMYRLWLLTRSSTDTDIIVCRIYLSASLPRYEPQYSTMCDASPTRPASYCSSQCLSPPSVDVCDAQHGQQCP